ncbi:MBL fold metallo-hydrolase [Anaerococcus sp. NML200537]|uniref:MBL fold metallo-hydrolase n=1 Tax=Anaerococcus sp. NML200537 TaxID=2954485 RepID=UPI0022373745|nr:MBL fold metallo-hydrolase [Anaerococcus sp. NML200537]MCW6700599.1 MBL fold metallo-hydrolase [Anaerococcus sp. NML200537]
MKVKRFTLGPVMTNMYVVSVDGKGFLVDCAYPSPAVDKYIEDNNIKIEFILQTHTHFDHVTGLKYYKDKYGVPVYASEDAKDIAEDKNYNLGHHLGNLEVPIDIYLKDNDVFSKYNIRAVKTPGHTIDSMCFVIDKAIFTGDTLFRLSIGRTDFPGGSMVEIIDSIKNKLASFDRDYIIYPGHNEESLLGFELDNNPFLN